MTLAEDALAIWSRGVDGVRPQRLIQEQVQLTITGQTTLLNIGGTPFRCSDFDRLVVIGAGKATAAMAASLEAILEPLVARGMTITGIISIPEGTEHPLRFVRSLCGRPAGRNEPTPAGVEAALAMVRLVEQCGPRDLVLALISGGGSALLPLPLPGLSLADKLEVTRSLSAAGAPIEALNVVRKHLSGIKGGKLAAACRAGALVTLVLSDILGDPLDLIASGPTIPDTSSPQDALQVLARFDPQRQLSRSVYEVLERQIGVSPPQPRGLRREVFVIGNNAIAVDAAAIEAERRGYRHAMSSSRRSEGTAQWVGEHLAEMGIGMLTSHSAEDPNCLITGGEPVVHLAPIEVRGQGGRNQQLVLAAVCRFLREPPTILRAVQEDLVLLSLGTDGEDGPTDAAGAMISKQFWDQWARSGLDPHDYLQRNDAYHFFSQTGGLIRTGPTGTNVCDLRVVLCRPQSDHHPGANAEPVEIAED